MRTQRKRRVTKRAVVTANAAEGSSQDTTDQVVFKNAVLPDNPQLTVKQEVQVKEEDQDGAIYIPVISLNIHSFRSFMHFSEKFVELQRFSFMAGKIFQRMEAKIWDLSQINKFLVELKIVSTAHVGHPAVQQMTWNILPFFFQCNL